MKLRVGTAQLPTAETNQEETITSVFLKVNFGEQEVIFNHKSYNIV
jgi:hypothetical protein